VVARVRKYSGASRTGPRAGTRRQPWVTREAQHDAVCAWGIPDHALFQRLSCLDMPVFVANVTAFLAAPG
jgi:hypothetical protein